MERLEQNEHHVTPEYMTEGPWKIGHSLKSLNEVNSLGLNEANVSGWTTRSLSISVSDWQVSLLDTSEDGLKFPNPFFLQLLVRPVWSGAFGWCSWAHKVWIIQVSVGKKKRADRQENSWWHRTSSQVQIFGPVSVVCTQQLLKAKWYSISLAGKWCLQASDPLNIQY